MKKLLNIQSVFENGRSFSTMSEKTYYSSIAGMVGYGLILTAFLAAYVAPPIPSTLFMILCGLVLPIVGIFVSQSADPKIAFLGYNLIVAPMGLVLGPVANFYAPDLVINAAVITGITTGLMAFAGLTYPNLFKSLGGVLFYSLLGLVIVRLIAIFVPGLNSFGVLDYIAAGIFSLYIGYDMYRASTLGRTWGNVVGISVSLYLDIINLFLSLLSIFGGDND
jgi:FtsH-binding integral membrane protein